MAFIREPAQSIHVKLVLPLVVLLLPIVVIQAYFHYDRFEARRAEELQANLQLARAVGVAFSGLVQDVLRHELAIAVVVMDSPSPLPPVLSRLLRESAQTYPVRSFSWVGPEGRVLVSSDPRFEGIDISDREYFKQLASGREWYVSDLVPSKASSEPIFCISRSARDNKGNLLGLVVANLNAQVVEEVLAFERPKDAGISLTDRNGMVVATYPAKEFTWEERNWLRLYPQKVDEPLKGREATTVISGSTGKRRLVAAAPVPSIGWVAASSRSEDAVLDTILSALLAEGTLFLIVTLAAFGTALAVSRPLSQSVLRLRDQVLALGRGDREDQTIAPSSTRELNELAQSFSRMAEEVRNREKALQDSETHLRAIFESTEEAIITLDDEQRCLEANPAAGVITGVPHEQLVGRFLREFVVPCVLPFTWEGILRSGRFRGEVRIRHSSGSERILEFSSAAHIGPGRHLFVGHDITDRKHAEEVLKETEERFRVMADGTPVMIWATDAAGRMEFVNRAYVTFFGTDLETVQSEGWNILVHPDDRDPHWEEYSRCLTRRSPFYSRVRVRRHDGEWRWVESYGQPRFSSSGEFLGMVGSSPDITEREQAEVHLRKSREDLNRAQAVAHIGSWRLDVGRKELTWSDETYRIFGLAKGTRLNYDRFLSCVHPEDREYVDRKWSLTLNGEVYDVEHRIVIGDTTKWVGEKAELEFHEDGTLRGGFGTVQDITERKLAEANQLLLTETLRILNRGGDLQSLVFDTLRLIRQATGFDAVGMRLRRNEDCPYFAQCGFSEEFLREENFLCEKGLNGAIVRDARGRAVLECTCGLVLSGRTDPSMDCFTEGGSFWTNVSHELLALPPEADPRTNPRNRCIHDGYESVGLFPIKSGTEILGLLQLNGRSAGRFNDDSIAFYETLAQNIGLALQRTLAQESLRESEERYRNLYDEAPVGYIELDSEGRIDRVNRKILEMLGYSADEVIGKPMWTFVVEESEAEEAIKAKLSGYEDPSNELERAYKRKVAPPIPVLLKDRMVRNSEGRVTRIRVVVQDISERKQIEEKLRRSRDELELRVKERTAELEKKNRELQEFAFIASHDLSEPLRKIQTFGDLLKVKGANRLGEQERDYVSRMTGAANRMQELLDALLRYSRVETKGQEFRPVRLNDIIKDAAGDLEIALRDAGVQLDIGPLPVISGDPYQWRQVFQNLIGNAAKYHRSEVRPLIKIYSEETDGACHVLVEDNGIGFDEKYLDQIFQPFQRLHGKLEYPGTGIGLAICKKIVERHCGRITARSTPGKGSTFIVILPVSPEKH